MTLEQRLSEYQNNPQEETTTGESNYPPSQEGFEGHNQE